MAEFFQVVLGLVRAVFFVAVHQAFRQALEGRVVAEDPGILIEGSTEQDRQACNQNQGQPEGAQDSPEE
ncbi:hypothetical protein D9M68_968010 [compost metagenome]